MMIILHFRFGTFKNDFDYRGKETCAFFFLVYQFTIKTALNDLLSFFFDVKIMAKVYSETSLRETSYIRDTFLENSSSGQA